MVETQNVVKKTRKSRMAAGTGRECCATPILTTNANACVLKTSHTTVPNKLTFIVVTVFNSKTSSHNNQETEKLPIYCRSWILDHTTCDI